jgi:ABC-type transporter Mla subunit MlaD
MWLLGTEPADEFTEGFKIYSEGLEPIYKAMKDALIPEENVNILTSMESKAKTIQRQISGIAISRESAELFRNKLQSIYFDVSNIGASFKDITDSIAGLSEGLNRVVEPSSLLVTNMVAMSKATGIGASEIGKITADFVKLNFSQEKSIETINKITESARRSGLNVKSVLTEVQKNLSKVNAYNFKGGVDGLTKMVLEAQRLGTTIDDIGAASLGRNFAFDPEKAIEAASSMSMLGGSMSDLMNPFQLMNMGANNVGKLQSNLLDMSKAAFKVNEATGEIESNAISQQRLYEQLKAFGKEGEYDKFINMGRESAKQAMIIKQVSESGLGNLFGEGEGMIDEKQQGLIAQLAEIGPGGKISLDLPGVGNISDLTKTLKDNPDAIKSALEKYDNMAKKSDRQIAESNLTIAEDQAKDVKIIKESVIRSMTEAQRTKVLENVEKALSKSQETVKTVTDKYGSSVIQNMTDKMLNVTDKANEKISKEFGIGNPTQEVKVKELINKEYESTIKSEDRFFGEGNKTLGMGKGEMFSFIKEDQAVFAPDLDEKLGILKASYMKMKDFENSALSKITPKELPEVKLPKTESTQKTEVTETKIQKIEGSGSVNINVNITSSGNLADTLINDRRFKNDLEKEILYVIKNKDLLMVKKP